MPRDDPVVRRAAVRLLLASTPLLAVANGAEAQAPLEAGPGVTVEAAYTGDVLYNAIGGVREGGTMLHNVDLTMSMDGGEALGIEGLEAFVYVLGNAGGSMVERTGDFQVASNIEAPAAVRLYELWVQRSWGDRASLRVGLYDLNSEFYVSDAATLFINSAHGIGPEISESGVNGPSILPVTSLAARLEWTPGPSRFVRLAVLDAVPGHPDDEPRAVHIELNGDEGALITVEAGWTDEASASKIALGTWSYTADFPDAVDPGLAHGGTYGGYLLGETRLLPPASGASGGGLVGFARIGFADADVHAVQWSWGGGLVYDGMAGREGDAIGLGVATGVHAARYMDARETAGLPVERAETAIELTYSLELGSWLTIQPDVQYIIDPGMDVALENALLLGARVEMGL